MFLMTPATINPLCDKDLGSMSPKELPVEVSGEAQFLSAYVCNVEGCHRCYNEAAGYFDFVAGRPILETRQTLCLGDAHAMYLEFVSIENDEIWRCPHCGGEVAKN
jgi:ubiquitin C-terminal hydrolase